MSKHAALADAVRSVLRTYGTGVAALRALDLALSEYEAEQAQRRVFEVTLPGFYGGTDDTDDRILWVMAPNEAAVREHLPHDAVVDAMNTAPPHEDVDFVLPAHVERLRDRVSVLMKRGNPTATRYAAAKFDDGDPSGPGHCVLHGEDIVAVVYHGEALASRVAASLNACEDVPIEVLAATQSREDLVEVLSAQGMRP